MISNIKIDNYKSIRNLDLEMNSINILIGSNGAGKSNFVGFFKFLKNIYDQKLQNYVSEEGSSEDIFHLGSKTSEYIKGQLEFKVSSDFKCGYGFKLKQSSVDNLFFDEEYALICNIEESSYIPIPESLGSGHTESKLPYQRDSSIGAIANSYMESFRVFHFHDTSKTSKLRKPANINDNDFLREDGSNLPAFLYWIKEKHPKDFKKIEATICSVAPFFEKFDLKPDNINEEKIRLRWKEKKSDAYFDAKHLSDGTLRFIALTTLLMQPEKPGVIIIDEPELGLHPFAINKLAGLINKASMHAQIIVSTQSVNLIDNFEPEDIITVDREEGRSIFIRHNSNALEGWLEDYSIGDLWNKNVIGGRP